MGRTCQCCGGEGHELGTLGQCVHFRCRQCGIEWSERLPQPICKKSDREVGNSDPSGITS